MAADTTTGEPEAPARAGPAEAGPAGAGPAHRTRRLVAAARPALFLAAGAVVAALVGVPEYDPASPRFAYALRAAVVGLVLVGAVAWAWSARSGRSWGTDLVPALVGTAAALTLAGSLNGTPFAPGGIAGDQSFRTAAITRFADSAQNADFTFQGLPSFYAPAYFWVLGRTADLAGIDPWRMTKYGTVLVALLLPLVTYLLWRRLVPDHAAAWIAVVPLVVENVYEPYSWLVLFAIVPWWLEAVHGLRRADRRPAHPLGLGLLGAALFLTYYYFFFVAAIALVIHLGWERARGPLPGRQLRRAGAVLAVAATASAVYWLPLLLSVLRAAHPESLANRWFSASHPRLPLPMLELSPVGAVALLGLGYLVWTVRRDALSRGLLVLLAAAYGWYLLGAAVAALDTPLLSFRGKPLIPMILVIAGVLALLRVTRLALAHLAGGPGGRVSARDLRRVAWVVAAVLAIYAGQAFVSTVRDSPLTEVAHATAGPDGSPPSHRAGDAEQPHPPPAAVHRAISDRLAGDGNPVLLSDRVDVLVYYPYYGFLQWNAHYAHPAAEFHARVRFLADLAGAADPAAFAARSRDNRFDRIDAFLLRDEGDTLVVRFADDAFPAGTRAAEVRFPRTLFAPDAFHLVPLGDHLLAVRR